MKYYIFDGLAYNCKIHFMVLASMHIDMDMNMDVDDLECFNHGSHS